MGKKLGACIYPLKPSKTRPGGVRLQKFVRDQWGDERNISERFREDDYANPKAAARRREREIDEGKNNLQWLKKQFPTRKENEASKPTGLEASLIAYENGRPLSSVPSREQELRQLTMDSWVMLGMRKHHDGAWDLDPNEDRQGYLRRVYERNSKGDWEQKKAIWSRILTWSGEGSGVASLTLDEVEPQHVEDFVRWLETTKSKHGRAYSKQTVKRYYRAFRSLLNRWSKATRLPNPAERVNLKPSRFKGTERKRKVVASEILEKLDDGFRQRVEAARSKEWMRKRYLPRRILMHHLWRVHRWTGIRSSELLYLETRHVDQMRRTLIIEGGAVDKEPGFTKAGKTKGSRRAGTREIQVIPEVIEAIQEWVEIRQQYGFPSISECSVIFCDSGGDYMTDDSLRSHYLHASQTAEIDPPITPHMVRHSLNDLLRKRGVPVSVRRTLLGHLSDEINQNYTQVSPREAVAPVEELWRDLSSSEDDDEGGG
ncbi:MAG: tyrosine-type recombinase/integrase [Myxococcota bacterium]